MIKYTYKIVLRKDYVHQDGTCALVLQAFLGGARVRLNLDLLVKPSDYDENKMQVKIPRDVTNTDRINAVLAKFKSRVEEIFFEARMSGQPISAAAFQEELDNKPAAASFLEFMEKEIEKEKADRAHSTIVVYQGTLKWLKKFRPQITFTDLNFELIQDFDRFMKKNDLEENTRAKYHRMIRKFVLLAIKKRRRVRNPYVEFKFRETQSERVWLNVEEVERLVTLYEKRQLEPVHQRTLRHFLFQVVTSVRVSDLIKFQKKDIENGMLVFHAEKTKRFGKIIKVPLSNLATNLVADSESKDDRLFAVPAEPLMNRRLKDIAKIAGIDKIITTHMGRHTFGFLYLLMGGKLEELREIMGHAKIETTMIYTHTDYSKKLAGVRKFDDIFTAGVVGNSK